MAFGDTIQSVSANSTGVTSLAVPFTSATAGNLLVAAYSSSAAQTWGSDPSGWALLTQVTNAAGNMSSIWYYKIAAGGETSVTATFDNGGSNIRGSVCEFEGSFNATPLDKTAEDEGSISTAVTSMASGTTATTSQADELLVAFFGGDAIQNIDLSRGYTNSFTEEECETSPGGRAAVIIAKLVVASASTYTTTFSTTDTGDEMYGAIATFKKAASGYTLTLNAGSYTVTGKDPSLVTARVLALNAGSYTVTGQDPTITVARLLSLETGSYTITGHDVTLTVARVLSLEAGSYAVTGLDATLTYSGTNYTLTVDAGGYTITGHDPSLTVARVLAINAGSYAITGNDPTLTVDRVLSLAAGSYTVTGNTITLAVARMLALATGAYTITGNSATLTYDNGLSGSVVALSDSALYAVGVTDAALYAVALSDSALYTVEISDTWLYTVELTDSALYGVELTDAAL